MINNLNYEANMKIVMFVKELFIQDLNINVFKKF